MTGSLLVLKYNVLHENFATLGFAKTMRCKASAEITINSRGMMIGMEKLLHYRNEYNNDRPQTPLLYVPAYLRCDNYIQELEQAF